MRIASSSSVMIFATPMRSAKSTTGGSSGPVAEASMIADWPRARISSASFDRQRIGDRAGNAGRHDLALQRPIVEVLQIAAEHAEHQLHAEVFEHGEIQQGFRHRGFRQEPGLDEHEKNLPAELGNILEDLPDITLLRHGLFLPNPDSPASAATTGERNLFRAAAFFVQ